MMEKEQTIMWLFYSIYEYPADSASELINKFKPFVQDNVATRLLTGDRSVTHWSHLFS